jgi:hypothetical protein
MNSLKKYLAIGTLATASFGGLEAQMILKDINNPMNPVNPIYWNNSEDSNSQYERSENNRRKDVGVSIIYSVGLTATLILAGLVFSKAK